MSKPGGNRFENKFLKILLINFLLALKLIYFSEKFKNSIYWNSINHAIEDAKERFPTEDEIKEYSFFNKNVTEMIEFINNSNDKFLDIIFWNAEEFAVRYQSHKLINVIEKNLYKIKDSPHYTSILESLEKAKIILG